MLLLKKIFIRKLETRILIDCSIDHIWDVLMDFPSYGQWNPFLPEVSGQVFPGSKIKIVICTEDKKQNYTVQIIQVRKPFSLTWLGYFGFPGIIDGHHQFLLEDAAEGKVLFRHEEIFQGLLVPLVWTSFLNRHLKKGFEQMNLALKFRCETRQR